MQTSIFDLMYDKFNLANKPIALIELFGGIGSQHESLSRLQEQGLLPNRFKAHKMIEFDKKCVQSYNAIHNTNFEPMDITKVHAKDLEIRERERVNYLMTYSFPCQDLSLCGKLNGMSKESGTRSSLLWEVERILNECGDQLPQVLLMENVPMVLSSKFIEDFKKWELFLSNKGYSNYVKILNAKDYGIPQNRKRCFMVSILGDYSYSFPPEQQLTKKLSDMLEENVDEKYFLSPKMVKYISFSGTGNFKNPDSRINLDIARPLTTEQNKRAGTTNYVSKDLPDNYDLTLLIKEATKQGYAEAHLGDGIDVLTRMETHRGVVQQGISQTIKTQIDVGVVVSKFKGLAIRRLTPRECLRLMGFRDSSIDKMVKLHSDNVLYKQAGNSIVVNVLEAIIKEML